MNFSNLTAEEHARRVIDYFDFQVAPINSTQAEPERPKGPIASNFPMDPLSIALKEMYWAGTLRSQAFPLATMLALGVYPPSTFTIEIPSESTLLSAVPSSLVVWEVTGTQAGTPYVQLMSFPFPYARPDLEPNYTINFPTLQGPALNVAKYSSASKTDPLDKAFLCDADDKIFGRLGMIKLRVKMALRFLHQDFLIILNPELTRLDLAELVCSCITEHIEQIEPYSLGETDYYSRNHLLLLLKECKNQIWLESITYYKPSGYYVPKMYYNDGTPALV